MKAHKQSDATDYEGDQESTDFKNGALYYVPPADFVPEPPAVNYQAIANAAEQLRNEVQLDHLPVRLSIIPSQPRKLFSLKQSLAIQQFVNENLDNLSNFMNPSHIQIRIEYEVLTVKCRDEFAMVVLVLILSTWVEGPFSLILFELVPRYRYTAIIPGLTEPDDTILSR